MKSWLKKNIDWPALSLAQDLIDAMWLEDLFGIRQHCTIVKQDKMYWLAIRLNEEAELYWQGVPQVGLLPFRLQSLPVCLRNSHGQQLLSLIDAVAALQQAEWWSNRSYRFKHLFTLSLKQAQLMFAQEADILAGLRQPDLIRWEVICGLKDRPFHPLARAKEWSDDNKSVTNSADEFIPFHWIAVPRHRLLGTACNGQLLAEALLNEDEFSQLRLAVQRLRLEREDHLWFPVHPWQWRWLNTEPQRRLRPWLDDCIDLEQQLGGGIPTSSLRTLAIAGKRDFHIKFSLAVNALGALRIMPPRYLHNGALAEDLLQQLRHLDAALAGSLWLCNEQLWWAVTSHSDIVQERGELACLLRHYPDIDEAELVPMAACSVLTSHGRLPAFEYLLRGKKTVEAAKTLFREITDVLVALGLRCFAYGVMPELHGQNVLLVWSNGKIKGLLLRDHDTLRICPTILSERGLVLPEYKIDWTTPNTLVLDEPKDLLAYFQTLAIEVNLYSIAVAMVSHFAIEEAWCWQTIQLTLIKWLERLELSPSIERLAHQLLLQSEYWPFKQVLAPLLTRDHLGTGMPSAFGEILNPVKDC
ncbi:MAG: IucA/IucC family protein [Acidobacteriota bacterium]